MSRDFEQREGAALVTGATGAIGSAVVRLLAERGSRVALAFRSDARAAAALAAEVGDAEAWQVDLVDARATAAMAAAVAERFGAIHTVVYASGPFLSLDYISRLPASRFREQVENDVVAFYNLVQPCVDPLRRSRGSLVAVGTTAVTRAVSRDVLSAAPKAAVAAVVRALALEEGRFGVRANMVGVGMTDGGMAVELVTSGELSEEGAAAAIADIPLRRAGSVADIAEAVCFLASDRAGFVTGQILNVDGGYSV